MPHPPYFFFFAYSYFARSPPMSLGRVRAAITMASPTRSCARPYRHRHRPQMHAHQRAADVNARVGGYLFHHHRVAHPPVSRRGQGTPRLGLGHHADDFVSPLFRRGPLHHQRPVQVFAALERRVEAVFRRLVQNRLGHFFAHLIGGIVADARPPRFRWKSSPPPAASPD